MVAIITIREGEEDWKFCVLTFFFIHSQLTTLIYYTNK